jgi:hypothetical protein
MRIYSPQLAQTAMVKEACYSMPAKKTKLTDAERAKRIRETAREIGTDNNPESLELAFKKIVRPKGFHQDRETEARSRPTRDR